MGRVYDHFADDLEFLDDQRMTDEAIDEYATAYEKEKKHEKMPKMPRDGNHWR